MFFKIKNSQYRIFIVMTVVLLLFSGCRKQPDNSQTLSVTEIVSDIKPDGDMNDPENSEFKTEKNGAETDASKLVKRTGKANGVDVSKWQGKIDWQRVKRAGIDFAIIRVGYRGENGIIYKDSYADYNLQQAEKAGVLTGVYFFSTAVSTAEAVQEAEWLTSAVEGYAVSYPIVYDCEGFAQQSSRMYKLINSQRVDNALAFLDTAAEKGYDVMFYSAKSELENYGADIDRISAKYKIWVAQYADKAYPEKLTPDYSGRYDMWQYTDRGHIDGIEGNTDMSVSYFTCEYKAPKNSSVRPKDTSVPENDNIFAAADEQVTAKIEVNLRDSATTKGNVVALLKNGEFVKRTGIGNNGWSRLLYNGKTVYAVSSYLTTDKNYSPPPENDGFVSADGQVTAKDETNLRSTPSVSGELVATIKNGEFVTRTGENPNGWTRLLYNGKTVYAKTSLLTTEINKAPEPVTPVEPDNSAGIKFKEVNEQVTAKNETNLRSKAKSSGADTVVYLLARGEFVTRTGVSAEGWSRLVFNGKTVYAVSSYLLTEEEYKAQQSLEQ